MDIRSYVKTVRLLNDPAVDRYADDVDLALDECASSPQMKKYIWDSRIFPDLDRIRERVQVLQQKR